MTADSSKPRSFILGEKKHERIRVAGLAFLAKLQKFGLVPHLKLASLKNSFGFLALFWPVYTEKVFIGNASTKRL